MKTIDDLVNLVQAWIDAQNAGGCEGCAFVDRDEWEMPSKQCKRNCRDYWRPKKRKTKAKDCLGIGSLFVVILNPV